MNEKISEKLLEYLQRTEDFVLEQSPEILKEALRYERIRSFISVLLMAVLFVSALSAAWYFWKHPTLDKYESRDTISFLGVLIPICLSPLFFVQLCSSVDSLIKIYVAPKYFLISLIMSLNKG